MTLVISVEERNPNADTSCVIGVYKYLQSFNQSISIELTVYLFVQLALNSQSNKNLEASTNDSTPEMLNSLRDILFTVMILDISTALSGKKKKLISNLFYTHGYYTYLTRFFTPPP